MPSDDTVVGLELSGHSFAIIKFALELDAVVVNKLALAMRFTVVEITNIQ